MKPFMKQLRKNEKAKDTVDIRDKLGIYSGVGLYQDNDNCNYTYNLSEFASHVCYSVFISEEKCIFPEPTPYGIFLVKQFVKEHYNESYKALSIYDTISGSSLKISNPLGAIIDDITDIIGAIALIENSFVRFIGIDEESKEFVVGMTFATHRLDSPCVYYKWGNGKLVPETN